MITAFFHSFLPSLPLLSIISGSTVWLPCRMVVGWCQDQGTVQFEYGMWIQDPGTTTWHSFRIWMARQLLSSLTSTGVRSMPSALSCISVTRSLTILLFLLPPLPLPLQTVCYHRVSLDHSPSSSFRRALESVNPRVGKERHRSIEKDNNCEWCACPRQGPDWSRAGNIILHLLVEIILSFSGLVHHLRLEVINNLSHPGGFA